MVKLSLEIRIEEIPPFWGGSSTTPSRHRPIVPTALDTSVADDLNLGNQTWIYCLSMLMVYTIYTIKHGILYHQYTIKHGNGKLPTGSFSQLSTSIWASSGDGRWDSALSAVLYPVVN